MHLLPCRQGRVLKANGGLTQGVRGSHLLPTAFYFRPCKPLVLATLARQVELELPLEFLGEFGNMSALVRLSSNVLNDWDPQCFSSKEPHRHLQNFAKVLESTIAFTRCESDETLIKQFLRDTLARPSAIAKTLVSNKNVLLRYSEDADDLLYYYVSFVGNTASDRFATPERVIGEPSDAVVVELEQALDVIKQVLSLSIDDLLEFPNTLSRIPFALANLAIKWKSRTAQLVFRYLECIESAGGSITTFFDTLTPSHDRSSTPPTRDLASAIGNVCAKGLGTLFDGDHDRIARFSRSAIRFVLKEDLGTEHPSARIALLNLIRKSPENRLFAAENDCFALLLVQVLAVELMRPETSFFTGRMGSNVGGPLSLPGLVRLLRRKAEGRPDIEERIETIWRETLKREMFAGKFTPRKLNDFEPKQ